MSNLYKQWFVHNENQNARVINSNQQVQAILTQKTKVEKRTVGLDGFAEGIITDATDTVIPVEEEQMIPQTEPKALQEEAEQILAQARAEADEILQAARAEAEDIRRDAQNQGFLEGQTKLEQELMQKRQQLEQEHRKAQTDLQTDYQKKQETMEKELVDVILKIFNQVFHIQFDDKKEILFYLIEKALMSAEGERYFRVKVSADNVAFLQSKKDIILDRIGHDIELEIVTDNTLEGNGCVIEMDSGVFDCGTQVQLENLIKDIKSLSL